MKPSQQLLFPSLPAGKPAPRLLRRPPRIASPVLPRRAPLWLAAWLPDLALETLLRGQAVTSPQAVIEPGGNAPRLCAVNTAAANSGVTCGMTLAAAWSLLPELAVHERDAAREQRLLHRLAAWAGRFTPTVCLDGQALLLEVRGSLQLFNGASALRDGVRGGLEDLGFRPRIALAPTPRAALWLVRAGREIHVDQPERLADALGRLPLAAAGFDENLCERLRGIGAKRLGDLMRLPRDGLARRYSPRVLRELDQALGRVADVRRPLPPPKWFFERIELLYEIHETHRLVFPVRQLLRELDGYLQATQQGVSRLQFRCVHRDAEPTAVILGFAATTRDAARILDLVEQKLETVELPAPVLELELHAAELQPLAGRDRELFAEQYKEDGWARLVERLGLRLGEKAVSSIEQREDHRPERTWRHVGAGAARERSGIARRPHWLLENPERLRVQNGKPASDGPLEILDGPERIETGWWDGADVMRDYYIARDIHGRRLWICREVKAGRWWLQGVFG